MQELVLLQVLVLEQELAQELAQKLVRELALQVQVRKLQELVQPERQAQRLSQDWQSACSHGQTLHGQIDLRPSLVRAGP